MFAGLAGSRRRQGTDDLDVLIYYQTKAHSTAGSHSQARGIKTNNTRTLDILDHLPISTVVSSHDDFKS